MAIQTTSLNLETICNEIHQHNRLVPLLIGLTHIERRKVRDTYMKIYGVDLTQLPLHNEDDDVVSSTLPLMMLTPFERDAFVARQALHRRKGTNYNPLVEIYTCRKSSHVLLIHQAYHARYRSHLDLDIARLDPPHPFQKMLVALSASHKAHNAEMSQHIAKCDAKRLYQTGEAKGRGGVDQAVVLEIFSKRSVAQLKLTFTTYARIYGHTYTSFLKNVECGAVGDSVRTVAKCICNPSKYYAKVLHGWLKLGERRDEGAIGRVMVCCGEKEDMREIEMQLKKKYGLELREMICEAIPQGNERDILLAMAAHH